jgi:hypothetical protein
MAIIRCPHCRLPLIEEEASSGVCPVCAAPLRGEAAPPPAGDDLSAGRRSSGAEVPVGPPPSPPPPDRRPLPRSLFGNLALCVLLAGIELYLLLPSRPADTPPRKAAVGEPLKRQRPGPVETPGKEAPDQMTVPPPEEAEFVPPPAADDLSAGRRSSGTDPKPPGRRRAFAGLPFLRANAITIDGDLSDWKEVPPLALKVVQKNESGKKAVLVPKTQLAYLAYCPRGLLFAVDVEDTSGTLENDGRPPLPARPGAAGGPGPEGTWAFWNNDAVEIYIDTLNRHPQQRGEPSLHQFFAFPFGTATDPVTGGYESRILKDGTGREDWTIMPQPTTGERAMLRAGKKTAGGWTLETLIPKSSLRQGEIRPGTLFGFELQVDTGTNVYYYWASDDPFMQASMHPDLWGEVLLAGSDATIEVLDAAGKPSHTFVPGRPLTVRVTDADVDLDPGGKDALVVTLRSRGGDLKKVPLRETGPDSGVFVGSIATRPSDGVRREDVFDVLDGDEVSVEYVDRWRGNGDRNVTVRTSVKASGAGAPPDLREVPLAERHP